MGTISRLGSVNAAIIALYFAPVWGGDGLRALISPFYGFEDQVQATAANYFRDLFELNLAGLLRVASILAATKIRHRNRIPGLFNRLCACARGRSRDQSRDTRRDSRVGGLCAHVLGLAGADER